MRGHRVSGRVPCPGRGHRQDGDAVCIAHLGGGVDQRDIAPVRNGDFVGVERGGVGLGDGGQHLHAGFGGNDGACRSLGTGVDHAAIGRPLTVARGLRVRDGDADLRGAFRQEADAVFGLLGHVDRGRTLNRHRGRVGVRRGCHRLGDERIAAAAVDVVDGCRHLAGGDDVVRCSGGGVRHDCEADSNQRAGEEHAQ